MTSNKMRKLIFIVLVSFAFCGFAQQKEFKGDPDKAFELAREMAFNNKRAQAQDTLLHILTKYPDYHDIRSFLASTYSWDGKYDLAKHEFDYIIQKNPNRQDTWEAAIKNELWSEASISALKMANAALTYFPENPEILYLKASAEDASGNKELALITVENSLKNNPNHEKTLTYKASLINDLSLNVIGLNSNVDVYSEVFDPMQYYTLKYVRQTKFGSIHSKFNVSHRFASTGAQFEIDAYPRIVTGMYAYLNFGISNSFLYPDIRYGAELHKSLPLGLEASLGFRALKYSSTTNIYTGSIGWYSGNSYWSFRLYVTPGEPEASKSGTLAYRKYRSDANNYLSIEAGMGFSPDIYRFDFEGNENSIINLKSQKLNFAYFFTSKNNKNSWGFQSGVYHQEISFDPGNYFWIYSFGVSWEIKFR
jgi:YaiO family outer membrane protein